MASMSSHTSTSLQSLPTELLLMIVEELLKSEDIAALVSLQQVSRRFHDVVRKSWTKCRGNCPKPPRLGGNYAYMEPCKFFARPANGHGSIFPFKLNLLHCSGCKCFHPARAFSRPERNKGDNDNRQCIGREAGLRLCEHETIYWSEVEERIAAMLAESGQHDSFSRVEEPLRYCNHHSHPHTRQYARFNQPDLRPRVSLDMWNASEFKLMIIWPATRCLGDSRERHVAHDRRARFGPRTVPPQAHVCGANKSPCMHPHGHIMKIVELGNYGSQRTTSAAGTEVSNSRAGIPAVAPPGPRYSPSHKWFHAVDPLSYEFCDKGVADGKVDTDKVLWPLCKDPTCAHYYGGYQTVCSDYQGYYSHRIAWDALNYAGPETDQMGVSSGGEA